MTSATGAALERLALPLRWRNRLAWSAAGVGGAALVAGGLSWLVRIDVLVSPAWVLWAWILGLVGLGWAGWRAWSQERDLRAGPLASWLEQNGPWRRGALVSLLDAPGRGTSPGLLVVADQTHARTVTEVGPGALGTLHRAAGRRVGLMLLVLAGGAGSLLSANPARGAVALLWHPMRALDLLRAPVRLAAERTEVDRGDTVAVSVDAPGRRDVLLWTREPGVAWAARLVTLDTAGRATIPVGPLDTDLLIRASGGGRSSDTVRIHVRLPAFLGRVDLTAEYPAYLGMPSEPLPVSGDTLLLPAGTTIRSTGETTTPLQSGSWIGPEGPVELTVEGPRFSGRFAPVRSGVFRLDLRTADGQQVAGNPVEIPVQVVPDSAPAVDIPSPGADTLLAVDPIVMLVVDARDDHGLRSLGLDLSRRSPGRSDSTLRVPLSLPPGGADRAILPARLVLAQLDARPGDTVRYRAWAVDNAPGGQRGTSREYLLLVPTARDERASQREETSEAQRTLDSLVSESRALERQAEDLARSQSRMAPDGGRPDGQNRPLSFDEARRAEAVAQGEEQLLAEAEKLEQSLKQLAEAAEQGGATDSAFARRLAEVREELRRALSPELRKTLEDLQKAIENLDAERTREAVERLAEAQKELREALERSRELFRRAALEGELGGLEQEAKEVAEAQEALARQLAAGDSTAASAQDELAARTDSLATGLDKAADAMTGDSASAAMQAGAERTREAAQAMRQASQAARQGKKAEAGEAGEEAAGAMQEVQQAVEEQREAQQEEWRAEVMQALDRALAETSRLAKRQLQVAADLQRGGPVDDVLRDQASVEEGVRQLVEQMKTAAGQNALVSPRIGTTLAAAGQQMGRARGAISTASPNVREAGARAGEAIDALNAAAYQMLRSRGDVSGSSSGSGLAEALERMARMAQQQGALSQQAGGLLPMAGQGALEQQLQQMAAEQRALSQELERVRAMGELSGAGELAAEAEDLARRLEAGRLDAETVARQERLFQRMLDAGRTLQGEEKDDEKERESRAAGEDPPRLPPDLDRRVRDLGWRWPSWDELMRYSPEERKLVADYFRRLSGGRRAP